MNTREYRFFSHLYHSRKF